MTENVENLLLEHMKRFQATLERIEHELRELKLRAANIESGQVAFMQHLTHKHQRTQRSKLPLIG